MSFQRLVSPTALLLWSLAACSSGDGPTEGNRSSSIAMLPAHVSIEQGASGDVTLALTRTNFTGPVTLAASNLPTGIEVEFDPDELSGTSTAAVVTIDVAQSASLAHHGLTLSATGQGVDEATGVVVVEVTAQVDGNP